MDHNLVAGDPTKNHSVTPSVSQNKDKIKLSHLCASVALRGGTGVKGEEEGTVRGSLRKSSICGQVGDCPSLAAEEAVLFWDYITRITVIRSRWAPVVTD